MDTLHRLEADLIKESVKKLKNSPLEPNQFLGTEVEKSKPNNLTKMSCEMSKTMFQLVDMRTLLAASGEIKSLVLIDRICRRSQMEVLEVLEFVEQWWKKGMPLR
jgi:hypothetical protein